MQRSLTKFYHNRNRTGVQKAIPYARIHLSYFWALALALNAMPCHAMPQCMRAYVMIGAASIILSRGNMAMHATSTSKWKRFLNNKCVCVCALASCLRYTIAYIIVKLHIMLLILSMLIDGMVQAIHCVYRLWRIDVWSQSISEWRNMKMEYFFFLLSFTFKSNFPSNVKIYAGKIIFDRETKWILPYLIHRRWWEKKKKHPLKPIK